MAYVELEEARELLFKFRNECIDLGVKEDSVRGILYAINELDKLPTKEVEEVKHGAWLDYREKITTPAGVEFEAVVGYRCSLCGRIERKREPYCNCGAKMNGERSDT